MKNRLRVKYFDFNEYKITILFCFIPESFLFIFKFYPKNSTSSYLVEPNKKLSLFRNVGK
jgi:hypothetical protein